MRPPPPPASANSGRGGGPRDTERKRPAVPAGAGGKRNGGEKAGESRSSARLGPGAVRWGTGCPARFGPARRGAHTCIAAAAERCRGGELGSARRCIAALQEPPPSPLPSPPSAAARLRGPNPGSGPAPPRFAPVRRGQPPPRSGLPRRATGESPPAWECSRGERDTHPPAVSPGWSLSPAFISSRAGGGGPARPVGASAVPPARPRGHRHSPAARPGRLPPPRRPPRRADRAVRPDGPPDLPWATHCPAPSPRASREGVGAGPAGSPAPPPGPGRAEGRCTGRPRPRGGPFPTARCVFPLPAVGALAVPVGRAEGGHRPRVAGPSGREAGDRAPGSLAWGQRPGDRCRPRVTGSCVDPADHDPRLLRAGGAKGSGAMPVGRSRRRPGVPGPAPLPGAAPRGRRGAGPRAVGTARPGTTGARSQGSRSVSALGKRQHGNKMAGKGWDCHGEPCKRSPAGPRHRPAGLRASVPAAGSGAGDPPGLCRRPAPPPGRAPVQTQLQKMAARRSPLNPAMGGGGRGDGKEAARPSPPAAAPSRGARGQAARGAAGGSAGRRDRRGGGGAAGPRRPARSLPGGASPAARRGGGGTHDRAARPDRARPPAAPGRHVPAAPARCPPRRRAGAAPSPGAARRRGGPVTPPAEPRSRSRSARLKIKKRIK